MTTATAPAEDLRTKRVATRLFALSVVPFIVLCTLNSAGYRYGASDQAFYVPAVLERLDPALFPRDTPLIASQARLTLVDETIAVLARLTGAALPTLFGALYVASLAALALGGWLIGLSMYRSAWTGGALVAALTLRHAIAQTGTNTLEGYFHPRQVAFACGVLAIAALVGERRWLAGLLIVGGGLVHPTTAVWFALWLGVAVVVEDHRLRIVGALIAALGGLAAVWAVTAGPLAGHLSVMDPEWLTTLTTKDYLFPLEWSAGTWALNLLYLPIIVFVHRRRASSGLAAPYERGLAVGCVVLFAVFLASLPLNAARVALAVQLQVPRIFWMLDFMAVVYAIWALAEGAAPMVNRRRAQLVACMILLFSMARGAYVLTVRFPDRPVAQVGIGETDWGRTMAWARTTDPRSGFLADPLHAARYGTSLRVAGHRDVFVEAIKDTAIGMYDRDVAMRTRDRLAALGDFGTLDAVRAERLGRAYDLDYLIVDRTLPLPLAFESGALRVYRLH